MARLKCKNCNAVFEYAYRPLDSVVHLGPYKRIKCPSCGKSSFFNVYSSVKDPITYPPEEQKTKEVPEKQLTEEELEKKRIEESKYERS